VRRFLKHNSLSVVFLSLFLAAIVFQSIAGHAAFNEEQDRHGNPHTSFGSYVTSSAFGVAVMENWQSEYLQFTLFVLLTVWFVQRGSPESKELGREGRGSDELLVMASIWIGTWFAQSITGVTEYNSEQLGHREETVSWLQYLGTADFWEKTLQNWQSEFLAVGSMAILAVYLRQRGSPESKPVGAAHHATGVEG
jgi:hypothetical protein